MSLTRLIVHYPYVILIAITIFSTTCLIIPLTLKMPKFSDPQLGFETRGTILAQRLTAYENLQEATKASGRFAMNPKDIILAMENRNNSSVKKKKGRKNKKNQLGDADVLVITKQTNNSTTKTNHWRTLKELKEELKRTNPRNNHNHEQESKDGFLCGTPDQRYSRVILSTTDALSLFTFQSLQAMCYIQHQLIQLKSYNSLCDTLDVKKSRCCQPWSVVNYVALLHNRTSCLAITEEDVNTTLTRLQLCSQYYHNLQLTHNCNENHCNIPSECGAHNAVYNILHYLTEIEFLPVNGSQQTFLKDSVIFLPIACSTKTIQYYHELEYKTLQHDNVRVVAMEFGLKSALFDEYLIRDSWFIAFGGLCVLFCMWIYTESLFLTCMTIVAIVFSLAISYFLYTLVFELQFFPFMNLLAIVVAVGIGADDAFIFCKVWQLHQVDNNSSMVRIVSDTFNHAFLSMFVTSLTTAAAFYTSLISSITAVCCFSVFAGTAVIVNFGLMVTWLPACLVVSERWCCPSSTSTSASLSTSGTSPSTFFYRIRQQGCLGMNAVRYALHRMCKFFEKCLLVIVLRFRYFCFITFSILAAISIFIVLRYPGLQLPDFPEFQLFQSSHPFEQYDLFYKQKFWFERLQKISGSYKMPLRFVWGILPSDNGDYMNPYSRGSLVIDETFDMSDPESQAWLLKFCRRLRTQSFYLSTLGPLLPNCFIESFYSYMQRRCIDTIDEIDRSPCCEVEHFPYKRDVFNKCIIQAMSDLYETPSEYLIPGVAGPKFARSNRAGQQLPSIQAVVVEYDSNYTYSMSFAYMDSFFRQVENWTQEQMRDAPPGMRNGWFTSELDFYDLQRVLSESTVLAIGIAMAVSFIVLLLVTLNVLISVFAIITISCSIFSSMAVLVLLGWKLNVLESIAVSTAVGLAVDFSLHYGVNYRLFSVDSDRRAATRTALQNMSGPTAMAALTTALAGALMLPSCVLAYIQIGVFLIVVMVVSWLYSTFLFTAMLSIAGPERGFGQFRYPVLSLPYFQKRQRLSRDRDNLTDLDTSSADARHKTVLSETETTLSTTNIVCATVTNMQPQAGCSRDESHELESLTENNITDDIESIRTLRMNHTSGGGMGMMRTSDMDIDMDMDQMHKCNGHKHSYSQSHSSAKTGARNHRKRDKSPSTTSDITIVMLDDN